MLKARIRGQRVWEMRGKIVFVFIGKDFWWEKLYIAMKTFTGKCWISVLN